MQHSGRITVIGAGFMGTVIATLYARHGYKVALHDTATQMLESYRERAVPIAESLAEHELGTMIACLFEQSEFQTWSILPLPAKSDTTCPW